MLNLLLIVFFFNQKIRILILEEFYLYCKEAKPWD